MAGSYEEFSVLVRDENGVIDDVGSGVSVKVRIDGQGSDAAESPLTTIANGVISAGSIAAASAGSRLLFRIENYNGLSASLAQIAT
jgi:hypothetical protein